MLNEKVTVSVDLLCICYLTFYRLVKGQFKEMSRTGEIRNYIMLGCCA